METAGGGGKEPDVNEASRIGEVTQGDNKDAGIKSSGTCNALEDEGDNEEAEIEATGGTREDGETGKVKVDGKEPEDKVTGAPIEAEGDGIEARRDIMINKASRDSDVTMKQEVGETEGDPGDNLGGDGNDYSDLDHSLLSRNGATAAEEIPATVTSIPICVTPTTEEGKLHHYNTGHSFASWSASDVCALFANKAG